MNRILPTIELIQAIAVESGSRALIVGGAVRDLLLGKAQQDDDLDVTIEGDVFKVAQVFATQSGGTLQRFPEFLAAKVRLSADAPLQEVDFVATRREVYAKPGALPTVSPGSLDDDIRRRDFSVNAMALPLQQLVPLVRHEAPVAEIVRQVIDPLQGWHDLQSRLIRVLHEQSFLDDPTRLFRAARYAARLGATLEGYTATLLQSALAQGSLGTISLTRKVNEMCRVAEELSGDLVMQYLDEWGIISASELVRSTNVSLFVQHARRLHSYSQDRSGRVQLMYLLLATFSPFDSAEQFFKELGVAKVRRRELLEAMAPTSRSPISLAYQGLMS